MRRALLILAILLLLPSSSAAALGETPRVGGYVPPIELADLGGVVRRVDWWDGGPAVTIIYFFDPQAPNCLLQVNFLDLLYSRARDFGLAVYAVESKGRQPGEVSRSLERYCALYRMPSFPILPDPSYRANRTYGVQLVPTTFITESHGVVLSRIEGYDKGTAVAVTRRVESLLRRPRGFFSSVLRESGITEAEERELGARHVAALSRAGAGRAVRALAVGDRAPSFEFTDLGGHAGRWDWLGVAGGVRVAVFFGGLSLPSTEALTWLDAIARRGHDAGLEAIAIEGSGLDAGAVQAAMERYRHLNPAPSFPVVADPGKKIVRVFGPWEALPQIYLLGQDGSVLYQAQGFGKAEAEALTGKIEKAYVLAGRPLPADKRAGVEVEVSHPQGEEAPSIKAGREQEERYRSAIVQADAAFLAWEFSRALPYYLAALDVQPNDAEALSRTAQIYERLGEPVKALAFWKRVLGVRANHAEAGERVRALSPPSR